MIKQTYALVWPATLVAVAIGMRLGPGLRIDRRALVRLGAAALASGAITWLGYCAVLADSFANLPLLLKPLGQYLGVYRQVEQAGAATDLIDPWLYLRNLSAYGMLAMMLVVPGLWFGLRSASSLQRMLAVAWIVLVAAMQCLPFKEVRYLGYLAPLTAMLIVPAIDFLTRLRPVYLYLCLGVLALDLALAANEALRLRQPYYRQEVMQFFADLPIAPGSAPQVVLNAPLSFISPEANAFRNDRFHRITHVIADEIRLLYGYPSSSSMLVIRDDSALEQRLQPGAIVYFVNGMASRVPPFRADNRPNIDDHFIQAATLAEKVRLVRDGTDYRAETAASQPLMLLGAAGTGQQPIGGLDLFFCRQRGRSTWPGAATGHPGIARIPYPSAVRYPRLSQV